jgi:nitrogen regulatory protein PII
MQLIKTIIRPQKLEEVQDALNQLPVTGMTISEVIGRGQTPAQQTSIGASSTSGMRRR